MNNFIIDSFTKARGKPALLKICCKKCDHFLCLYQKDGPGPLKRSYLDRIREAHFEWEQPLIRCPACSRKLGYRDIYEKENREAIFWFVECVIT